MITTRKAEIVDRQNYVVAECPVCHTLIAIDVNFFLGERFITFECDHCDEISKIDMFEYHCVEN